MYGPNTIPVERFVAHVGRLDVADFASVVREWREMARQGDAWLQAEDAVGEAVARTRRDDEMWRVQDAVYQSFRGGPWYTRALPRGRHAPPEAAAQYLAATTAVALMVADVLPPLHLDTLYAPFERAIPLREIRADVGELGLHTASR